MLANYEKFGFKIKAEHLPESCTWCPFWTAPMADVEFAGCYITGSEVRLDTGEADKRRMPDCPIKCKRGRRNNDGRLYNQGKRQGSCRDYGNV